MTAPTDTLELEGRLRDEVAIFYGYATANEMLNSSDAPASWWENDTRWKAATALAAQREQIERLKRHIEEWKQTAERAEKLYEDADDHALAAERKLAECERDAERHRMLLTLTRYDADGWEVKMKISAIGRPAEWDILRGQRLSIALDAAIDKARQDAKERA